MSLGAADGPFATANIRSPEGQKSWGGHGIRAPGTLQVNPTGATAATVNETREESVAGDCNGGDDAGHDVYGNGVTESPGPAGGSATAKVDTQMNFEFNSFQTRQPCSAETVWQLISQNVLTLGPDAIPNDPALIPPMACGTTSSAGTAPGFGVQSNDEYWSGTSWLARAPSVGVVDRNSANPVNPFNVAPAAWAHFYASTSLTGVSLPHAGGDGTYGVEWCTGGIGTNAPVTNGWDCDPAHWSIDPKTGKPFDRKALRGNVGDAYQLRDVVCWDTTVLGGQSSLNPTHQDIGLRIVPVVVDPAKGCY